MRFLIFFCMFGITCFSSEPECLGKKELASGLTLEFFRVEGNIGLQPNLCGRAYLCDREGRLLKLVGNVFYEDGFDFKVVLDKKFARQHEEVDRVIFLHADEKDDGA